MPGPTHIHFAFGKTGIDLPLPPGHNYRAIECRSASPLPDPLEAIEHALDHPIGTQALVALAAGKKSAAISVCDITRPAPNSVTLPPILERLHRAGIPTSGITILIATGLHRPATADEIRTIVGPHIASTYRIVNHDARQTADHRSLGTTRRGTPVAIDHRFLDADLHITLGFIEQHLMLGFSGGRKLVAPGLAAQETIKVIHSPRFMREPRAVEGSIEDNPLHDELLEIAHLARHDFMLDVTLTRQREISGVFAGEPVAAHAAGVQFLRDTSLESLSEPADLVVTSSAGYPLDLTLYQAIKGITAAQHIVRPGGNILLIAECAEGVGSPEFASKLKGFTDPATFLDELKNSSVVIDQWQMEKLALACTRNKVFFYTPGVAPQEYGGLASHRVDNIEIAIPTALQNLPRPARVALLPEGPYVFARVQPSASEALPTA